MPFDPADYKSTIEDHRKGLTQFHSQHLAHREKPLNANTEAALCEAALCEAAIGDGFDTTA